MSDNITFESRLYKFKKVSKEIIKDFFLRSNVEDKKNFKKLKRLKKVCRKKWHIKKKLEEKGLKGKVRIVIEDNVVRVKTKNPELKNHIHRVIHY